MGIFFYIYCSLVKDIYEAQYGSPSPANKAEFQEFQSKFFITKWLKDKNSGERAVAVTYYAFTSLSTVGFGDIHPRNSAERVVVAMILLFGVAIFSYVMGNFIEILNTFRSVNDDMDDGYNLFKFFGLLKQFNKGRLINFKLKISIEDYMEYRWKNDKNQAISSEEDMSLLSQLPHEPQKAIYKDFLFFNFLNVFRNYFSIQNNFSPNKNSFYTWENNRYHSFMIAILQNLEPIHFQAKTVLYNELDDVNEVTFIEKGLYDIGYEINKKHIFKIRMPNRSVIGTFEVCFDKRMLFIFKAYSECRGFFIRKLNFQKLEEEFGEFYQSIKVKAMFHYFFKIRRPMMEFKQSDILFYDRRADF